MVQQGKPVLIVIAEDDEDYFRLVMEAFKHMNLTNEVRHVEDGEELLDYLLRRGRYQNPKDSPKPGLILLDLNMPKKNGFTALEEIRANPEIREIPVVILTISNDRKDILLSYSLGANSFVTKPFGFESLIDTLKSLQRYWFTTVQLPTR